MNKDDWSESISFAVSSTQLNFNSRDILRAVIFELPRSLYPKCKYKGLYWQWAKSIFFFVFCLCVCSHLRYLTQKRNEEMLASKMKSIKKGWIHLHHTTSLSYVRATLYVHEYVHFTVASVFNHAYKTCLPSSTAPTFWRLSDNKILVVDKAQDNVKNLFNATLICAAAKKSP